MNGILSRTAASVALAVFLSAGAAFGETTVSVTISGSVDELIPLLRRLKKMGIGTGAEEEVAEGTLRVRMHSVSPPLSQGEATKGAAPGGGMPALTLRDAVVLPAQARAGETVLVSLRLADPQGKVDTIGATLRGVKGVGFDLYDNGTRGDAKAGDGVWSFNLVVPESAAPGDHTVVLTAFDRNGAPVPVKDKAGKAVALTARVSFRVLR